MNSSIMPGDKVLVFDNRLYKDDRATPLSTTMKLATVIRRYGYRFREVLCGELVDWKYPDCLDVVFDHDGRTSHGHFTDSVIAI